MNNTTVLPAIGDRVIYKTAHGLKIRAKVTEMSPRRVGYISSRHPEVELSPGGVRIVEDNGCGYSFHPQTWMSRVLSGAISVES